MIFASHAKEVPEAPDYSRDFNGHPMLKWIHDEGYLLYYYGSNDKSLWAEWDVLESLFSTLEHLYSERVQKLLQQRKEASSSSFDHSIHIFLDKFAGVEDFNSIIEVLLHDQSPYKAGAFTSP